MSISLSSPPSTILDYSVYGSKLGTYELGYVDWFLTTAAQPLLYTAITANSGTSTYTGFALTLNTGVTDSSISGIRTNASFQLANYSRAILNFRFKHDANETSGKLYGLNRFSMCGICDTAGVDFANMWFDYTAQLWYLSVSNNSSVTDSTGFTMDVSTPHDIRIECTSTNSYLYKDGVLIASVAVAPRTNQNLYFKICMSNTQQAHTGTFYSAQYILKR